MLSLALAALLRGGVPSPTPPQVAGSSTRPQEMEQERNCTAPVPFPGVTDGT